jgi:hypothetical protein
MNLQILKTSLDSTYVLTFVNSDCQVNYGCNLKWKPGDENTLLAITANFREKTASKALG